MINKKVILLPPFKYFYQNRLIKYMESASSICARLWYYKALEKIFSEVIAYDYGARLFEIGPKGINEEIIKLVRKEHPDYLIWTAGSYEFQESTFDSIRKEGTIVVGVFVDDTYRFDEYSKYWIPHIDYCVTSDIEAASKYRELGAKYILEPPITGDIVIDRDWSKIEEKYNVSFVGHKGHDREKYIKELKKRNIPIQLFGGEREGGYVSLEEMLNIYWSSKINLNFSKTTFNKLQMKGRVFEVCMTGGFLLTEYVPYIENYFEIDKEIVCFKNSEEMIDKINYYLNHDEERRAIAKAGWERAINNYTSFHLLSDIFKEIEDDINPHTKQDSSFGVGVKMSRQMCKNFSNHYFGWGLAFAMTNSKKLWKDALSLSLSYKWFNVLTWCCYFLAFSPCFMRPALFKLYKRVYKTVKKFPRP